jgi:ligand-binding sensor domain-containing protein/uncharacterized membrane-anchored protein YhcB (DUF1043 family)
MYLLSISAYAQSYSYKHYTIFDGLVQNQITALYQDHNGFIWIGTKDGISRFDGIQFVNYKEIRDVTFGLSQSFKENNNFLIWHSYDKIILIQDDFFKVLYNSNIEINNLYTDNKNKYIYISVSNKVLKLTCNAIINYYQNKSYKSIEQYYRYNDKEYIVADHNLLKKSKNSNFTKILNGSIGNLLTINEKIYFSKRYSIDYKNNSDLGIYKYDGKNLDYILKTENVTVLYKLKNKNIFCINNFSSWMIIDTSGNVIYNDSIPGIIINNCLEDNEGNIWLGTETGLLKLQSFAFRNYTERSGLDKYIWSVVQAPDSSIWFASYNGKLYRLKNGKIKSVSGYESLISKEFTFYMGSICTDNGVLLFTANHGKVISVDKGKFEEIFMKTKDEKPCTFQIYEDIQRHKIYFGTERGVFIYNKLTKKIKQLKPGNFNALCLEKDKYNRIWIGGKKILLCDGDTFVNFKKSEVVFDKSVVSLCKDNHGNMWLCSKGGIYLHTYNKVFKILNESCYFIKLYKNRYLITGGVPGFYFIDLEKFYKKDTGFVLFFDRFNGFTGIECGQNGTCIDYNGHIWIPTSDKVVEFLPEKFNKNNKPPLLHIYSFEISSTDLKWQQIKNEYSSKEEEEIKLNHYHNNIRINYIGISISCPEKVKYKTRLIGWNNNWSEPTSEKNFIQTNLPYGNYSFELLACNADGIWNSKPLVMNFQIIPAFWQTSWFLILIIILSFGLTVGSVYLIMRRRKKNEHKKQQIERELVKLQISTINAQIDPHFVFNAITAIGTEVQDNNPDLAYKYFVKISNLLRSSLENPSLITRTIAEEIKFVINYLTVQKFRFGDRFEYKIEINENIDMSLIIPKMCIQIFVENALKHGLEHKISGGLLTIRVHTDNSLLHVFIEDNGIGRKQSMKYTPKSTGIGLSVFENFFNITNKFNTNKAGFEIYDIENIENEELGTKVHVYIPTDYRYNI